MSRNYFEEVQQFKDNRWIWIFIIFITLVTFLPLSYGIYSQVEGKPWGDRQLSNNNFIFLFAFVFFTWIIAIVIILSVKLDVKIDEQGIHYRFRPLKRNWKLITKDLIAEYRINERFKFFQAGLGHHRNLFSKTRSFRIRGGHHLFLLLKDGEKLLLGTQKSSDLDRALKRLMTKNEHG